jgi:hypothetical protein
MKLDIKRMLEKPTHQIQVLLILTDITDALQEALCSCL